MRKKRILPVKVQSNQIKYEKTSAVILLLSKKNFQQVSILRQDDAEVEGIGGWNTIYNCDLEGEAKHSIWMMMARIGLKKYR